jgi:hypothetical protein
MESLSHDESSGITGRSELMQDRSGRDNTSGIGAKIRLNSLTYIPKRLHQDRLCR